MKHPLSAPFLLVSNFAMLFIPSTSMEAIYRLRTYEPHLALSRLQALELLEARLTTYHLLALYQTFFPDQFATSTRSIYPVAERHSDREIEFLQLLATHCFPVSFWTIEQAYESRIEAIPVLDMGVDWHQEDALESLKDEWKILIPLTSEGRYWFESVDHDCVEWYEAEFGITLDRIRHPDQVPPKLLRQRCMKAGSPFKFLPLILTLLDKSTGSVWLDAVENEAFYGSDYDTQLPWSVDSIRYLTRQWRQAKVILGCCCRLTDWLSQDLLTNFKILLELWNRPYPKPKSR